MLAWPFAFHVFRTFRLPSLVFSNQLKISKKLYFVLLQGEGDAAIAVWAHQERGGIILADSISSYILGGTQ